MYLKILFIFLSTYSIFNFSAYGDGYEFEENDVIKNESIAMAKKLNGKLKSFISSGFTKEMIGDLIAIAKKETKTKMCSGNFEEPNPFSAKLKDKLFYELDRKCEGKPESEQDEELDEAVLRWTISEESSKKVYDATQKFKQEETKKPKEFLETIKQILMKEVEQVEQALNQTGSVNSLKRIQSQESTLSQYNDIEAAEEYLGDVRLFLSKDFSDELAEELQNLPAYGMDKKITKVEFEAALDDALFNEMDKRFDVKEDLDMDEDSMDIDNITRDVQLPYLDFNTWDISERSLLLISKLIVNYKQNKGLNPKKFLRTIKNVLLKELEDDEKTLKRGEVEGVLKPYQVQ